MASGKCVYAIMKMLDTKITNRKFSIITFSHEATTNMSHSHEVFVNFKHFAFRFFGIKISPQPNSMFPKKHVHTWNAFKKEHLFAGKNESLKIYWNAIYVGNDVFRIHWTIKCFYKHNFNGAVSWGGERPFSGALLFWDVWAASDKLPPVNFKCVHSFCVVSPKMSRCQATTHVVWKRFVMSRRFVENCTKPWICMIKCLFTPKNKRQISLTINRFSG